MKPSAPLARCAILVFSGCNRNPSFVQDRRHQLAGLLGLLAGGAQDHQVIRVLHQHPQPLPAALPRLIEHVQGDVGEQR